MFGSKIQSNLHWIYPSLYTYTTLVIAMRYIFHDAVQQSTSFMKRDRQKRSETTR